MTEAPATGQLHAHAPVVRQRAVLVLPSTAEFDSRTYRIASALAARGHAVTVLARRRAGLAAEELHPAGYRVLRVDAAAIDGLPFPGLARRGRKVIRRLRGRHEVGDASAIEPGPEPAPHPAATPSAPLPVRAAVGAIRRLAIPLTIRAQGRLAHRVAPPADLYHGMAYMGIPIALDLARRHRARVVYDARDIYLEAANLARLRGPARWLLARAERRWARRADRVITVNRPYADEMAWRFGVPLPLIVMNCSYRFTPPDPPEHRFHRALGLPDDRRIVLYQGGFSPDRGIEELMAAIRDVPNATLVLLGYGALEAEIRARASRADLSGRVAILPAVSPTELLAWVASADVVAMPIQPATLNHRLTTPNKLFEAMAAGVAVVASDLPGMAPIVRETGCGLVVDPTSAEAISAALRDLLDDPAARAVMAARGLEAAHSTYNWECQMAVLLDEYTRLTGRRW